MAWDFETDPEYQQKLDWAGAFVRGHCEPLDLVFPKLQFVPLDETRRRIIDPLKEEVRKQGLWATHFGMIQNAAAMGLADGPTEVFAHLMELEVGNL